MRVGNQEILLPTTMVGNYPNPRWYDGQAFATFPKGEFIYDAISREALEDAVLRDRARPGDGRAGHHLRRQGLRRRLPYGRILYHYYERMTGFRMSGPPIGLPDLLDAVLPHLRRRGQAANTRSTWPTCAPSARPPRSR